MKRTITLFGLAILFSCASKEDLSSLVYPQMDSAHSRWAYFASACRPFGLVSLFPDTDAGDDWVSGYRYDSPSIVGLSHIHCWQISGVSVIPVTFRDNDEMQGIFKDCSSSFSHENEIAKVGYHKIFLDRYSVTAELTSTMRTGYHKYSYSCGSDNCKKGVLFNFNAQVGPCVNNCSSVIKKDNNSFEGCLICQPTYRRPKPFSVFFHIEFDKPVSEVIKDSISGNSIVCFNGNETEIQMKVAISYTSVANARENLLSENTDWNFDSVVNESKEEWNNLLSRIEVKGKNELDRARFYTDLWHVLLGKHTISDCNGYYPDNTGEQFRIRRLPLDKSGKPLFRHFNTDGFWGGNCSFDNIWPLIYPDISYEQVMSLMQYYKDGGLIPRGPSGANYTYVMAGDCSCPFIVSAIHKGIIKDSLEEIYYAIKKNHEPGGIMEKTGYEHYTNKGGGLQYYISLGYVPYPNPEHSSAMHQQGGGLTLYYAYEDYALSQLAKTLGKTEDYRYYLERSKNYKNVYDSISGYMRPKDINGKWKYPFDPYEYADGFIESNASQATWFVPHDIDGLADLMGGKDMAAAKLNSSMDEASKLNFTSGDSHNKETFSEYKRIPINYGNQPSIHTAFMFHGFDRPDLSQYWSRRIVRAVYSGLSPYTGYSGDEDQGSMSCLAVAMKIGLFQVDGGVEQNSKYQIGSPIFDEIKLHLLQPDKAYRDFTIHTINNSDRQPVVKKIRLNGLEYDKSSICHQDLISGGELELEF